MELKWTSKALSDLARFYDFLAPVDKRAAARTVQMLTKAPTKLLLSARHAENPAAVRLPRDHIASAG